MRRTRITTITHELTLIQSVSPDQSLSSGQPLPQSWCDLCQSLTTWLTPEQAAAATGLSPRQIYRAVETGELHFAELADRSLRICVASLSAPDDRLLPSPPSPPSKDDDAGA